MRVIPLSDYAGQELARARHEREAAQARSQERYQRELAAYHRSRRDARARRDQAGPWWRPFAWVRWALTLRRIERASRPRPPVVSAPDADEAAREAGVYGEQEVADVLGGALDEAWALVKGYSNARGEIDYLLLGPGGLFAVEVKYVNGTFTITRDRWSYVKYDNYGNPVEHRVLADRGQRRRPPHLQLGEPLQLLEGFLEKSGQPVRLRPVVVLNHPKARIEHRTDDIGVQVLTSTAQLLRLAQSGETAFSAAQLARIEHLIVRDHNHHAERRRRRAATARPRGDR
jgi:hypothetical protein